jgi:uncharacterized delta-60 repeat protein
MIRKSSQLPNGKRLGCERLEDRTMLAFSAPEILIANDAGHLETAEWAAEAGYRNIMTQSDGKVVVAGSAKGPGGNDDFYLARYHADGVNGFVLDTSFGNSGVVLTNFASGGKPSARDDYLRGAAIDSQDRIVAVGESRGTDIIARYTPDGQLDTTFSGDGYDSPGDLIYETQGNDWRVAFDSSDSPVVTGLSGANNLSFAMFRYDAAGNYDDQFGFVSTTVREGVFGLQFGRHRVVDIAVYPSSVPQHAGKIVLTGTTVGSVFDPAVGQDIERRDWTVLRFNTDGSLDSTFDGDGFAFQRVYDPSPTPFVFNDGSIAETSIAQDVLLEDDGRIVVSGFTAEGMTITRYNADGSYDTTLNSDGIQPGRVGVWIEGFGHVDHGDVIAGEFGTNLAVDADGNYVVGGSWIYRGGDNDGDGQLDDTSGTLDRFAFAKFLPDGSLDTSFGDNGTYLEYVGAGGNRMVGLVANNTGEIWAAGYDADRKSILFRFAEESDNQSPAAVDDVFSTDEDTLLSIGAPGVLANDSDPDGDAVSVTSSDSVSAFGAAVTVNTNGSLSYDPRSATALQNLAAGESLLDSLTYTISDGRGGTATATVTVTVDGVDEPPTSDTAIYVYDIRFESKRRGKDWRAVVEIRDEDNAPVAGVTVKVDFAGTTYTLTTDSNGIARTAWERNLASDDYYADAYDLALTGYVWDPFSIALEEDDSDGDGKPDELLMV